MTSRARHEEWAMGVVGKQTPTTGSERMDRIEKLLEGQPHSKEKERYRSDNRSILKWTSDGKPICSRCKTEGHIGRECPTRANGQGGLRGRTQDEKVVCYGCEGIGHIRRDCPSSKRGGGHHNKNSISRCDSLERVSRDRAWRPGGASMANSEDRHPEDGSTGCVVLGKTSGCRDRHRGGSVRVFAQIRERTRDNSDTMPRKSSRDSTGRSRKAVSIGWEEFVEEEAKKRRARRWSTMHCLTEIDNRMAAHEEACLTTLRELESSLEHLA
ncbi:hypothetical protein OUZ56_012099 [Daphnia magna]|uniref:CCHC-type domain-containing protein n=1 Tax=Daphnia magna TaxID=35525 RepID=A0ABQ9Z214_9CRUS|nr:hypothetical protein OUZ56_012099 [Daphnia magna]